MTRQDRLEWTGEVGIDEVGRGPGAGPLTVCGAWIKPDVDPSIFTGLKDSKVMRPAARERIDAIAGDLIATRLLVTSFATVPAGRIDEIGLSAALAEGVTAVLIGMRLELGEPRIVIDGRPIRGISGECIRFLEKADAKIGTVALAACLAKVRRDKLMIRLHEAYPSYGWCRNKGYLTAEHRAAIASEGLTPHHRKSFGIKDGSGG